MLRMWEGLVTGSSFTMGNTPRIYSPRFHYTVPNAEAILEDGYWSLFVSDLPFHGLDPVLGGKGKRWRRSQGDHLDRIHRGGILCRESYRTWTSLHQYDRQSLDHDPWGTTATHCRKVGWIYAIGECREGQIYTAKGWGRFDRLCRPS